MTKKFIFLTMPKSASNYLGTKLSLLPEVTFLNSIFSKGFFATHFNMHNSGPDSKTGVLTELFNLLLSDDKIVNELIRLRTDRAPIWLLSIMQMSTNGYLGVKIHPYLDIWYKKDGVIQFALDPTLILDFLAPKYNWKIFTMSRKNFQEQMASSLLSLKAEYFSLDDQPDTPDLFIHGKITNADIDKYKEILSVYKKCYQYIDIIRK
ncbi:MAG: hypothetical protein HC836_22755 [Richelia sp. RM2_1_2]|nr:hypothetical protein [Richelia sp. RM2_1_2]